MKYILDTNILIEIIHGNINVINKTLEVGIDNCYMSIISVHELYYGAYNMVGTKYFEQEINRINKLKSRFPIIQLSTEADNYANIKKQLKSKGKIVDEFDILIGSQALDNNLIVVTDNIKHFERMPHIKLENWLIH